MISLINLCIRVIRIWLFVIVICYGSTIFFIKTGSTRDVRNYCHKGIMKGESVLSQRVVACNLDKHMKRLGVEAHGLYNRFSRSIQDR